MIETVSVKDQIIDAIEGLNVEQLRQVLAYTRLLNTPTTPLPPGTSGEALLVHMNEFQFAPGAVDEMMRTIEEDCERIDLDGWQ